jgi:DNA-binding response OmpR family regulator
MKVVIIEDDEVIVESVTLTLNVGWQDVVVYPQGTAKKGLQIIEEKSAPKSQL